MDLALRYTQLGFSLTELLDKNEAVDPGEIGEHIGDGTLFGWLRERYGKMPGLSLTEEEENEVLELFASLNNAVDPARKFGVRHNGLALLAAYCFEGLQQLHLRP